MAKQYLDKNGVQQVWNAAKSKFMPSSGTATRPTYNGNNLALYSDIPSTAKNLYVHTIHLYTLIDNTTTCCRCSVISSRATAYDYSSFVNAFNGKCFVVSGKYGTNPLAGVIVGSSGVDFIYVYLSQGTGFYDTGFVTIITFVDESILLIQ